MKRKELTKRSAQRPSMTTAGAALGSGHRSRSLVKGLFLTLVLGVLLGGGAGFAAIHCIQRGAAGASNGSDWANAYTDIPATLIRGDTYYVASGTYGAHTFLALAGTTYVNIKKA